MAMGLSQRFFEQADQIANLENREDGGEGGEEPEGDDEVPEHAVLAVESAEFHAGEFEAFEGILPVSADLAAEGEVVGVGVDPIARIGFADGDAVGDFERVAGEVVAAIPEDDGGQAEEEAEAGENMKEDATHDEGVDRGGGRIIKRKLKGRTLNTALSRSTGRGRKLRRCGWAR